MELRLDESEVKDVLLDWAAEKWPDTFNTVKVNASYGHLTSVELTFEKPEPAEVEPLRAA